MKWQGINEFVSVAETHSFSQAAKHLGISTAQVSRQITALEKRLKVKLFYRTTRHVSLTAEAEPFYRHCRQILDELDMAEQTITNLQSRPQGKIKLTAPPNYGELKVLPLINDFVVKYNDIEITTELTNRAGDLVENGFDLAIRLGVHLQDSSLIAKKLSKRSTFLCASPNYLKKHGYPQTLADLKHHNCLRGSRDYWRFKENGKEKLIKIKGSLCSNSGVGLADAAMKDIGIVQLSDSYIRPFIESGQLVTLLNDFWQPEENVWAVYPQNKYLSPKIRLLIDYLAEHLN
ncbi:LysR family transcriptional regulator [Vibrio sp. RC27]